MRAGFLFLIFCFFGMMPLHAQVFWTENFSTGTGWNLNVVMGAEGSDPNFFTMSAAEGGGITPNLGAPSSCGVANNGNNTLHVTSVWNPSGGASYDAGGLCGLLTCPLTNRRAESPIINCSGKSNMTLSFNMIHNGQGTLDNAVLWLTSNGFSTQVPVPAIPKTLTGCGGQGLWTSHTVSVPASFNNSSTFQFAIQWVNNDDGVGTDPSFAIDDITLSSSTVLNTITCSSPANSLCACYSYSLPFVATGSFNAGNTYSVQLSDASGSFNSPVNIGSVSSTALGGNIPFVIPCSTAAGSAYRLRVVGSSPSTTGADNGINLTINTSTPSPQMFMSFAPAAAICQNTPVTFTTTFNPPASPAITWKKNGVVVGVGSSSYTTTLQSGDNITCVAAYGGICPDPMADSVFALFNTIPPAPSVGIQVNPGTTICQGEALSLTGTGATTYNWFGGVLNGQPFFPSSTSTYSVVGTDANGCTNSSSVTVTVAPNSSYSTYLVSNPANVVVGLSTQYTASINPTSLNNYQLHWYRNNQFYTTTVVPQNAITLTPSGLQDSVYAWLVPNGCYSPDSTKTNTIKVQFAEGIENQHWPEGIAVYPNPVSDYLIVEGIDLEGIIRLQDLNGRILFETQTTPSLKIPVSSIAHGLYILRLDSRDGNWSRTVHILH